MVLNDIQSLCLEKSGPTVCVKGNAFCCLPRLGSVDEKVGVNED